MPIATASRDHEEDNEKVVRAAITITTTKAQAHRQQHPQIERATSIVTDLASKQHRYRKQTKVGAPLRVRNHSRGVAAGEKP